MTIHKIAPMIYTHSLKQSLQFYIQETGWFRFHVNFGMGFIRLQSNCHDNFFLEIWEKADYDYLEILKPTLSLYVDNLDTEFERLQQIIFMSGAKFDERLGKGIFEYPAGRNFTLLDPTGNKIVLADTYYL